jgi:hypothetical protein
MRRFLRSHTTEATPAVPTSPLSRPLDIVLHIGMGKTGTSSIQFFLRDNRERLSELGLLYPKSPGGGRHHQLGLFLKPEEELSTSPEWARQKQPDAASFRKAFRRRLFSEIEKSGLSRVLLSDEILFGSSEPTLRRLRRFTDRIAKSTRVVTYLRRQDDHMVSRYQQLVKVGWILRLRDWAQEDMSDLYDYYARLRRHEQLLAPNDLVVRRYERDSFVNGSLYQDFLDAAGVDVSADDLEQGPNRNQSLDAESVEFLRLFNLYRVENEGATPGLIDNRALGARLAEVSSGPVLSLPASSLDGFMAQWAETNELVARRFLADASGQLFRMPRKADNITTEQHLDPDRLDHFLTVLELPEQIHAPLRTLVEREAKNR